MPNSSMRAVFWHTDLAYEFTTLYCFILSIFSIPTSHSCHCKRCKLRPLVTEIYKLFRSGGVQLLLLFFGESEEVEEQCKIGMIDTSRGLRVSEM
jgi:hypothetical protein